MLINQKEGSYFIIGSLLLNQKLEIDLGQMDIDHCGHCTSCADACPTQAINLETRTLEASKCISTFTIEVFKEVNPPDGYEKSRGEIFGCDICQDVCPWNRKPLSRVTSILKLKEKLNRMMAERTGKTYTAVALAVRALKNKLVKKIILTRPAVEAGESLGFLPGDLKEKIDPYLRPLYDALDDMIPADKLGYYMQTRIIEIAPLAYMRGRTLDNAFIILDEAQNTNDLQIKMFLTRIGPNAKAIITGDPTQIDLPKNQQSGLFKATRLLRNIDGISYIELDEEDVVRHRLVKSIIKAYNKDDLKTTKEKEAKEKELKQPKSE
jgi:ferredoxin